MLCCCCLSATSEEGTGITFIVRWPSVRKAFGCWLRTRRWEDDKVPAVGAAKVVGKVVRTVVGEREPLPVNTRQPCRNIGLFNKEGTLTMKLVNVRAIDTLFSDVADAFTEQHGDHCAMLRAARELREACGCAPTAALTACVDTLRHEHGASRVQVHVEGYSFSLVVKGKQVPEKLRQVQRRMGELSRSTKRVLARTTTLREMICSMLQSQTELEERIKAANPEYLDQVRLESNLRENMQKLSLAKELSEQYDGAARSVLREMATLAGSVLEGHLK